MNIINGGLSSPDVVYWTSDQWATGSNPTRALIMIKRPETSSFHLSVHLIYLKQNISNKKCFPLIFFRTQLKLESLEDACVLDDEDDDSLADKHGCPAYVSPEILTTTERYSGKAADMWSLGVILYTMLIGRYPFQDSDAGALFTKIRRGLYNITDTISSRAKCLIRSLLRMNPLDRLTAEDVVHHPWFGLTCRPATIIRTDISKDKDQLVPSFDNHDTGFELS